MYEGTYLKDKKEGFGIFKWASGNIYRGQYKEDEREGIGEMRWVDGSSYIGQWERGIQHGYGKMKFPDGTIKEGLFENNIYKGPAKKANIPQLLRKPLDIMSLAPKGLAFSAEICYWNTALPQSEKLPFDFPLLKPSKSESTIVKMAKHLGGPLGGRNSCKSNYSSQANSVRKRAQSNTGSNTRRILKPTSKAVFRQLRGSQGRGSLKTVALTDLSPLTKLKRPIKKKVWIPSGIAFFINKSKSK